MDDFHTAVLLKEVVEGLKIKEGGRYIDATIGGGGYAIEILKRGGEVLGIDCDPEAIAYLGKRLKIEDAKWRRNLTLVRGNFRDLEKIAKKAGFEKVNGILFDLGVSSHQFKTPSRGFSFSLDGPLDMRMDPAGKITAYDLVNNLTEGELYEIFTKFGEENNSRAIARALVRARAINPIKKTSELAQIVTLGCGKRGLFERTHPATKVFQALRIAVNRELENLRLALPQAVELLRKNGRLAVTAFHSLEDRIVKLFLKNSSQMLVLTEKPVRATLEELKINPRARSGKLRIARRN